jgi:putative inorganic carbon (HCO3(-)) transporter
MPRLISASLDRFLSFLLLLFLLVYPFFLHPQVVAAALGFVPANQITALDFFYGPRAQFLFWFVTFFLVVWSIRAFVEGGWGHRNMGMDLPLILFLGFALLSTLLAGDGKALFGETRRAEGFQSIFSYLALFLFGQHFLRQESCRRWALGIVIGGAVLLAIYGIGQSLGWEFLPRDSIRAEWIMPFATLGNPIFLGSYLLLALPLPLYFVPRAKWWLKIALAAIGILFLTAIFLTGSRGAWLGLAVSVVALWLLQPNRVFRAILLAGTLVLILILVFAGTVRGVSLQDRLTNTSTLQMRLYTWKMSLPALWQKPFFGWGPDRFGDAFPQNAGSESMQIFGGIVYADKAHNDLLQVAVTTGLLGLAAYLFLMSRFFWLGLSRRRQDKLLGIILPGLLGYWASLQLSFSVVSVAPFFWLLSGMSLARNGSSAPA